MSFNRLSYDNCSYKTNLGEQVSQLSYLLDPIKFENCNKCRHELGLIGGPAVSQIRGNLVDLESDLFSITRPQSLCPSLKYLPRDDNKIVMNTNPMGLCHRQVDTNKVHLKPCQMFDYKYVPQPPQMQKFSCDTYKKN